MTTAYAAKKAGEIAWDTPMDLNESLLPAVHEYAKKITSSPNLRLTFALNAMVAVDNAAWMLYCQENGNAAMGQAKAHHYFKNARTRATTSKYPRSDKLL